MEINNNNYLNCYNKSNYNNYFREAINSNYTTKETNKKIYEGIIDIFNKKFDVLKEEGALPIRGKDDYYYQLSTVEEELNSLEENNNTDKFSKIDLGKCENLLREKNNINKNVSLIIFKYEKISNISAERNLQFEIYESLNKKRLNLSVCNNVTIDVYVPVTLSENFLTIYNQMKNLGYDLFDINSEFYQDICIPFKTPKGTDIILSDRIDYYYNNEEIRCQPNCRFSEYSFEKQNLKCECDIENNEINFENNNFNPKNIYKSFYDVLKYSNYKVLKCYKLAFSFNIFKNNMGNIISIVFIIFFLILLFIYFIEGITTLKNDISKNISHDIKFKNDKTIKKARKIVKNNIIIKKFNNKKENFEKNNLKKSKVKINNFPPKRKRSNKHKISNSELLNINRFNCKNLIRTNIIQKEFKPLFSNMSNKIIESFELNNLDYNIALNMDKRNCIEIYWSFLKREHLIIFTFFVCNDHNIIYVKYSRFIFVICTDMALNVFFFADETMHKMFVDYGKYNFIQQIPQILYSSIASQILEIFLCFLSLTDKHYYQIKNLDDKSRYMILRKIKFIKIKLCFFFIFTGLILLFDWYTITCFCAVYENTQKAFLKDSFLSFSIGLLYPFIIYTFPTLLRILSLRCNKGNLSFIYKLSDMIPCF